MFSRARGQQKTESFQIKVNSAKKRLNQMRSSVNFKIPTFDMIHSQFFSENKSAKNKESTVKEGIHEATSDQPAKFVQVNEFIFQILALVYDFDKAIVKSGKDIRFYPKNEVLLKLPKPFVSEANNQSFVNISTPFSEDQWDQESHLAPNRPRSSHAWADTPSASKRRSTSVRSFLDCGSSALFGSQVNPKFLMSFKPSVLYSKPASEEKRLRFKGYLQAADLGEWTSKAKKSSAASVCSVKTTSSSFPKSTRQFCGTTRKCP